MKRGIALVLLVLFLAPLTAQEPQGVESITYLPRTFYVGDVVEMRLELPGIAPGDIIVPEILPEVDWFLFRQVSVQETEGGSALRILFSSYQPGIRLMPAVDLGALILEGIRVDTSSILEREKGGLAGAADPLFLPKTGLYFGMIVGILLGVPLVLILLFRGIRNRIVQALVNARRRRPYQRLSRALKDLDRRILNRNGNVFYTSLIDELKRYISHRTGEDFSTLTGRETGQTLTRLYPGESFLDSLKGLFLFAEEVKFGGRDPYTSRKREDLNAAVAALEGLEEYYRLFWSRSTDKEISSHVDR